MARRKNFSREEVLEKAIPVFWIQGFADTKVEDLEKATGVNKSGLYAEFANKEDIFIECLKHYVKHKNGSDMLKKPPGWHNLRTFLRRACPAGEAGGCFAVNCVRELSVVPEVAHAILAASQTHLKELMRLNLQAAEVKNPEAAAEVMWTFFSGLCLEQNMQRKRAAALRQIDQFLQYLGCNIQF